MAIRDHSNLQLFLTVFTSDYRWRETFSSCGIDGCLRHKEGGLITAMNTVSIHIIHNPMICNRRNRSCLGG